jgi:hypothetical protein
MKFIGQYIQKFIARFKNDVFLEDVGSGTIASGGNLGLDSNNKIVKADVPTTHDAVTLAGSLDYITLSGQEITRNAIDLAADVTGTLPVANGGTGVTSLGSIDISSLNNDSGFTSNTGDITSMALSGLNSGGGSTTLTVSSGDGTFQFMGGEGISVSLSTLSTNFYRLTMDGEDASTSNKGIASFSSDNFADSSGEITIKSGGVDLADEVTGTLPVGNGGTGATTLTSNSILTGNGTSAIQAEAGLTYDSETLNVGNDDDGGAVIARKPHADGNGGSFQVRGGDATSGQTNKDGGDLFIIAGKGTGSGTPGIIQFQVPTAYGAGLADTTLQSSTTPITIDSNGLNAVTGLLQIGATDTSLSRLSAGVLGVEGNKVLMEESEVVNIGDDDNGIAQIKRLRHTDDEGGDLYVRGGDATGTDKAGGDLQLFGGRATGSGTGGGVIIQAGETNASSGTTLRGANTIASFRSDGDTLLTGNLIFEGPTPDVNETTFSITDPTADRTITVPDASGTMAFLDSDITGNAATATALTSGDKTIEGNLRIGGSGDTSNNWISIDAQNGSDTTGGGITFYETGTYSVSAPQYGAKIVYNEDDDELAIGTMHNNTFMRQIHMDRSGSAVYWSLYVL